MHGGVLPELFDLIAHDIRLSLYNLTIIIANLDFPLQPLKHRKDELKSYWLCRNLNIL